MAVGVAGFGLNLVDYLAIRKAQAAENKFETPPVVAESVIHINLPGGLAAPFYDETARIKATKALGQYKDPLATQAISSILIESTGDGYLRRMAAQGLHDTLPGETSCDIFRRVADREADMNLLRFLLDMLEKNCGR